MAVAECKRLGVPVLPPDINKSIHEFSIEDETNVRFGFTAVKNVGTAAIEKILAARKIRPFISLTDFCSRVDMGTVNKKTMESLIKAGAMDAFGKRAQMLMDMPEIINMCNKTKKDAAEGQVSLFGDDDANEIAFNPAEDIEEFTNEERLNFEKEYLGFYLTAHPYQDTLLQIKEVITHEIELLEGEEEGSVVKIGGIIESAKKIFTKKNNAEMAFITIANEKGITVEVVVFPKVYELYKDTLIQDNVVVIDGKLNTKDDKQVILAERIINPRKVIN
jgi:DNA polymerase-3 subunit alpha